MSHVLKCSIILGRRFAICECGWPLGEVPPRRSPEAVELIEANHRRHVADALGYQCEKQPFLLDVLKDIIERAHDNHRALMRLEIEAYKSRIHESFKPAMKTEPGKEP